MHMVLMLKKFKDLHSEVLAFSSRFAIKKPAHRKFEIWSFTNLPYKLSGNYNHSVDKLLDITLQSEVTQRDVTKLGLEIEKK